MNFRQSSSTGGLHVCIVFIIYVDDFFFVQMANQAESGLFLPHDVRCEQRSLLRPGMPSKEQHIPTATCCSAF